MENLVLVEPKTSLMEAFQEMVLEYRAAGEYYAHHETALSNFAVFMAGMQSLLKGENLPSHLVSMTTYWLVKDDQIILGESRLRHGLTPALENEGGHIGYSIRPAQRRKGYGTCILKLTLEKAREMDFNRVLVTCDTDNIASARIIEKNGGVLSGYGISPRNRIQVSQYWIDLGRPLVKG
jgi:predicted acetyltransferase